MATRTEAQLLGSQGQTFVAHLINSNGEWIARTQDEDYGIDQEAELAVPQVSGHLLKLQIKASRSIASSPEGVLCKIPKKLARYAESCRLPVILIQVDLEREEAWYVWVQQWLLEKRRSGTSLEDLPEHSSHYIPVEQTLRSGLCTELKDIAQWRTRTQLVLTVSDAIRTSAAVYDYRVLDRLVQLLDVLGIATDQFPINLVIEQALSLGSELWGTHQGNQASSTLYSICRHYGKCFSKDQIWRMVTREESVSRTGLNALGILYDESYDHLSGLNLVELFLSHSDKRIAFYCHLRELHPHTPFVGCMKAGYSLAFEGLALHPILKDDFFSKWPNRGDSVLLDYLYLTEDPDTTAQ